jgi:hypothetical protein
MPAWLVVHASPASCLGERRTLEQRLGVLDEHERRVGRAHAAAGALEQRHAGHRFLLRKQDRS